MNSPSEEELQREALELARLFQQKEERVDASLINDGLRLIHLNISPEYENLSQVQRQALCELLLEATLDLARGIDSMRNRYFALLSERGKPVQTRILYENKPIGATIATLGLRDAQAFEAFQTQRDAWTESETHAAIYYLIYLYSKYASL